MPNWKDVLEEIQEAQQAGARQAKTAVDAVRKKYLLRLHENTGRNIISYYSGFLSKPELDSEINDEDKNGFMMAIHGLDRSKGLDLILHTPGGSIAATQSIVNYLHQMFDWDLRAIVPQIAMSAGTMIACSCREIVMGKHSNLGPIDPHLRGIPARGVISEFKKACREIKTDPSKIPLWQTIIGQYRPTFLTQCENAIKWSDEFVTTQLSEAMFSGLPDAKAKARRAVRRLNDFGAKQTHNQHLHFEDCKSIGLRVSRIEENPDFQDLLMTVHHCYMHALMNTPSFKMIENHEGTAFVKQARAIAQP